MNDGSQTKSSGGIRYRDGQDLVTLGDRVRMPIYLLFSTTGRIVYVPGQSSFNEDWEHDGIQYVGIKTVEGTIWSVVVDPETGKLIKNIRLIERAPLTDDAIQPWDKLSDV